MRLSHSPGFSGEDKPVAFADGLRQLCVGMNLTKRTSGCCNCRGMVKIEPTHTFTAKDRGSCTW